MAAVSSVSPATPFQSVPPAVSQTPVIAATPVPTITANITSVPVPPAAAPPPPSTPIIPVVPPTPPVVKVSVPGDKVSWLSDHQAGVTGFGQVWGGQGGYLPPVPGYPLLIGCLVHVTLEWFSLCPWGWAIAPDADGEPEAQGAAGHTAGEGGLC